MMEEETKKQIWIFAFMLVIGVAIILAVILLSNNDKQGFAVISNERTMTPLAGKTYAQLSWNNVNLIDSTNYNSQSNICTAQRFGMNITIYPCNVQDIDGKDIRQDVKFQWNGAQSRNISWIFVYEQELESGSISALVNQSYQTSETQNTWVNNYLVDKVVSYVNTSKPDYCDLGNLNNSQFYDVTRNSANGTYVQKICFTTQTAVNSTAFRISGNADISQEVTRYRMDYVDVTNQIQYLGKGLLNDNRSYYKVNSVTFNPNQIIDTKWVYTPKNKSKSGKWHILGYETETGLVNAVTSETYLYIDPWWSGGASWVLRKQIDITGTIPSNYSINLEIQKESQMNSTYSDIRFTDSSGNELPYYIETSNTTSASVWIKIQSNNSIYLYYNNPLALSTSDIQSAFILGDDFNTFNTTNWACQGTQATYCPVASGYITAKRLADSKPVFNSTMSFTNGYGVLMYLDFVADNTVNQKGIGFGCGSVCVPWGESQQLTLNYRSSAPDANYIQLAGNTATYIPHAHTFGTFQRFSININSSGSPRTYFNTTLVDNTRTKDNTAKPIGAFVSNGGGDLKVDKVAVYKYVYPYPIVTYGPIEVSYTFLVTLNNPANGAVLNSSDINFNFSISADKANYTNYTLTIWNQDGSLNRSSYSVQTGNTAWTIIHPISLVESASTYKTWNVELCGYSVENTSIHFCKSQPTNNTFLIDLSAPMINITEPVNNQIYDSLLNKRLNWTITDSALDSCWYRNITGQNVSVVCGTNTTLFNFSQFGADDYIILYANDTTGKLAQTRLNITAVNVTYSAPTYSAYTYDTVTNGYLYTIQKSPNVTAIPTLWYNGTAATNYSEVSNGVFNISYQIPAFTGFVYNRTNNFYINWTLSFNGGTQYNQSSYSLNRNQSVYQILFGPCSNILTTKALNVTFIDEGLNTRTNATLDASSFTYSAASTGTGSSKSFTFANTTFHNFEYDYCIYPQFAPTITVNGLIQASKSDSGTYPQRKYYLIDAPITNTTTNVTVYLLNVNNGITSSYQVITIGNQVISGAYIKLERVIAGTTVKIADGYTDSSGIMTAFLNPNYEHTLTASKTGYTTQTHSLYPSQSIYTITMGSAGNYFYYNNTAEGITWAKYPPSGIIVNGMYNFTLTVSSRENNIYNCSFYIRYPNQTLIASALGCNTITPNDGGLISAMVNVTRLNNQSIERIYGEYYLTTDDGLMLIEKDANWRLYDGNYSDYYGTIKDFLNESYNLPEWGDNPATRDFSRIVFFFLILAIALAILNFFTGYDTAYPGAFLYLVTGIVFIASAMGGVQGPGWFYLEDAVNLSQAFGGETVSRIFNNWILFIHFALLSAIYYFTTNKRYQLG